MNAALQSKTSAELGAIIREACAFLDRSKGHIPQPSESQNEIDRNNAQRELLRKEIERLQETHWIIMPPNGTDSEKKIEREGKCK